MVNSTIHSSFEAQIKNLLKEIKTEPLFIYMGSGKIIPVKKGELKNDFIAVFKEVSDKDATFFIHIDSVEFVSKVKI